jgi:hypothetical protein
MHLRGFFLATWAARTRYLNVTRDNKHHVFLSFISLVIFEL